MSFSSSFLLKQKVELDVYLSYCCDQSFIDIQNILFDEYGINTFRSYRCLETSFIPINQQTREALEEARVAVVMILKRKPYTIGFLEELRVIFELQAKGSLTVIPIFVTSHPLHDVEEEICQQYPKDALSWENALQRLFNIAAEYPFSQYIADMYEVDRFKRIAHDIYLHVLYPTSNNSDGLVAMNRHMKVFNDLLASEVNEEVRTIGIWGSAGVGKTTLARYIFAEISLKFQTYVFLENVENIKDKILEFEGKDKILEFEGEDKIIEFEVTSKITEFEETDKILDPSVIRSLDSNGHEFIEARRKHRKIILIADDVNNIEQGKWIIEYANCFAPGSIVILISQNENLLLDAGVKHAYEVRSLRYNEALQLFSHFAFRQPNPPSDFEQLAVRAVQLAGFLPLALRLLGSFLTGKDRKQWLAALLKLKANRGGNIMEVWKLMELLEDQCQEQWEAAVESAEDKGQENKKFAAEIMERKESAAQDKQ